MAIAADAPVRPDGIQRGRGGFMRNALDVPYVSDPTGATTKHDGNKADLVALCVERGIGVPAKVTVAQLHELLGGRPKRIPYSSTSGFGKLVENGGSLEKWTERQVIHGIALGVFPDLFDAYRRCDDADIRRTIADEIAMRAKDEAKLSLAADRGTHVHAITEHNDRGDDWSHLMEAGEALGITRSRQVEVCRAWQVMLIDNGLDVVAIEQSVVDDTWRCAGTLDRIVRTTQPLSFALPSGEIVTVPEGIHLVLDIKTGSVRKTAAIQMASYAQSCKYDTEAETREAWPFDVSQEHGLIAHISIDLGTVELVHVDLAAGREHGGACVVQAKEWERRADVFSVAQIEADPSVASPAAIEASPEAIPVAPPVTDRTPAEEQEAIRSRPAPDEGDDVVDPTYDVLQRHYTALAPEGRAWITALTEQAMQGGVSFHSRSHRTQRRYSIIRALVLLAENGIDDTADGVSIEDTVRTYLEAVIGDVAQFPTVPLGHLIGSLSATEAATFAGLVDGTYLLAFTDAGKPTLATAA